MKINKTLKTTILFFLATGLFASAPVWAGHGSPASAGEGTTAETSLLYTSKALNHAIHSYLNIEGVEEPAANPQIVYVDQAHGQAIYSYPRVGRDTVAAFNVEYVDQAYGQGIYSYPGVYERHGRVEVLPFLED